MGNKGAWGAGLTATTDQLKRLLLSAAITLTVGACQNSPSPIRSVGGQSGGGEPTAEVTPSPESPARWEVPAAFWNDVASSPLRTIGSCVAPDKTVTRPCQIKHFRKNQLARTETCVGSGDEIGVTTERRGRTSSSRYRAERESGKIVRKVTEDTAEGRSTTQTCTFIYEDVAENLTLTLCDIGCDRRVYDSTGRLARHLFKEGRCTKEEALASDEMGQFWREEIRYEYDEQGPPSERHLCALVEDGGDEGTVSTSCSREVYRFTGDGRLLEKRAFEPNAEEARLNQTFSYNNRLLIVRVDSMFRGEASTYTLRYDDKDRVAELSIESPSVSWRSVYDYSCRDRGE